MSKNKISKRDFDAYLGKDSYFKVEDKERFYKNIDRKQKYKRKWFPQVLSAAFVLGLFFLGYQVWIGNLPLLGDNLQADPIQQDIDYRNTSGIVYADSIEEVWQYFYDKAPGLERAIRDDLVTELNDSFKLGEKGETLHLDRIWYTGGIGYLFYSFEMPNLQYDTPPADIPYILSMETSVVDGVPKSDEFIISYPNYLTRLDGIIYDGRLYKGLSFVDMLEKDKIESFQADLTVQVYGQTITEVQAEFPIHFNKSKLPIYSATIDQTIKVDGYNLTFNKVEINVDGTTVWAEIEVSKGHRLAGIETVLKTNHGEEILLMTSGVIEKDHQIRFIGEALDEIPEDMTIDVKSLDFVIEDETIHFSLDVSDYQEWLENSTNEKRLHQHLGNRMNTDIYLESLVYDEAGVTARIQYQPEEENQDIQLKEAIPQDATIYNGASDRFVFPLLLTAVNEKGYNHHFYQAVGDNTNENSFLIFFERYFIENSERIEVTIENLLYSMNVDQSVTFSFEQN